MYNKKRRGPSTEPWGTPDVTGTHEEKAPLITTLCRRAVKKLFKCYQ